MIHADKLMRHQGNVVGGARREVLLLLVMKSLCFHVQLCLALPLLLLDCSNHL